jgi:predicted GIY-YIG superfamily endonuclease
MIMGTDRSYWVYILASAIGGTLYIGVTNNLVRRVYDHRMGLADGFTKKYASIDSSTSNNTARSKLQLSVRNA